MNTYAKSALRKQARENIRLLSSEEKLAAGARVANHIDLWLSHVSLKLLPEKAALFRSLPDEISTSALEIILKKHNLALSWPFVGSNKTMGFEPHEHFDIIFVPGLAFDVHGHRLGRGQGHYDRYLSALDQVTRRPILVGLCLDEQFFESVPTEAHDVVMNYICTPTHGVQKATCE